MRKIIITTGCDPREPWQPVLNLTVPRFQKYAALHGYDFRAVWYHDVEHRFGEFHSPHAFTHGAVNYEARKDFISWNIDRGMLAPNWIRYAAVMLLLEEYDVVVYLDGDVVIGDYSVDVLSEVPDTKWLASPLNGPSPDNAGPGGPLFITRSCAASKDFWRRVWEGKRWITHPWWTDGVDFMAMLGYTIEPPIHKIRETEYDPYFHLLPRDWMVWFTDIAPSIGKFYHPTGAGSGAAAIKTPQIARFIEKMGI